MNYPTISFPYSIIIIIIIIIIIMIITMKVIMI